MIKNKTFLIFFGIFIFLGAFHQVIFSRTSLREVPELMATMRAKEFCSCFYMLKKGEEYCLESVKKGYPLFEYKITKETKSITFKNKFAEATAQVENPLYGCSLK